MKRTDLITLGEAAKAMARVRDEAYAAGRAEATQLVLAASKLNGHTPEVVKSLTNRIETLPAKPKKTKHTTGPNGEKLEWVLTNSISVDAEAIQYKESDGNEDGLNPERRADGYKEFNPLKVPPLALWKDGDGQITVVDGHKRLHGAKCNGCPVVRAYFIQAKSAEEAKKLGKKANEKTGTKAFADRGKYTANEHQMHDAVQAEPHKPTPRLALADSLEEGGHTGEAHFQRALAEPHKESHIASLIQHHGSARKAAHHAVKLAMAAHDYAEGTTANENAGTGYSARGRSHSELHERELHGDGERYYGESGHFHKSMMDDHIEAANRKSTPADQRNKHREAALHHRLAAVLLHRAEAEQNITRMLKKTEIKSLDEPQSLLGVLVKATNHFDPGQPRAGDGKWVDTGGGKWGHIHEQAASKTSKLLKLTDKVGRRLLEKVQSVVQGKYDGLKEKYGETGAKAILAATIVMAPIPVPGTAFMPIALANAVVKIKKMVSSRATVKGFDEFTSKEEE